ncbi:hypothetical protein ABPG72_022431 [Tetrahymena utriculariae]
MNLSYSEDEDFNNDKQSQDEQIIQVEDQDRIQHKQQYIDDKEQKENDTNQHEQDQIKQLQDQLNANLKELEIKDATQILPEIQETLDDIQKLKNNGQEKQVQQKKEYLQKLKDTEQILLLLQDLIKRTVKTSNQTEEEQLNKQLKLLLEDLEIKDVEQIPQEIEEVKQEIQKYLGKYQQKKASDSKIKLDKLVNAQEKYQELLKLKGETLLDQAIAKRKQLEDKLNELLQEIELQDANQIESEIQETKNDIEKFQKKGQKNKEAEMMQTLEKLQNADKILKELQDLIKLTQNQQNLIQEKQLQQKLISLLNQLEVKDVMQIPQEIQETEEQIKKFINKNQVKYVDEYQTKLRQLEEALRIQEQLNLIKNKNNPKQYYPQDLNLTQINQKDYENSSNLLQNQPIDIMKRFNLDDIKKEIQLIPESSEKYVLQMLEICLNLLQQQVNIDLSDQGCQQLLNQIEKIQKRFLIEDQITPEINLSIQNIKMNVDQNNFEVLAHEIDKLMKKIRPLNINEMKRLIQQADMAAKMIEGQEIILLLGGTGAGKSTTIHFLAGSQMGFQEIQLEKDSFLQYIAPVQVKNRGLQKIKVGFSATSETRFITPVSVNFKDLDMPSNGSIILCDSPGFDDTAGPEVDIANGLGIVKAIKKCKSVRPVILLSFKSMGDRGQGIKQIAHILVGFVQNIQDKLSSFSYLFSKFPEKYNIISELINIKNSLDQNTEEISDKAFVSLFEDMIDKTKKQCNKIDPINGNPSEILKVLIKEEGIQDPSQVFKFSITANSYATITDFIFKSQQTIFSALKRSEYKLIEYKLDEIKFLFDILNQDSTKQTYEYCVNYIKEVTKKEYENATLQLNQQIQNNNKLDQNYLKQYQELIQKFSSIQDFRNKHLGNNAVSASDLIDELKSAVNKLTEVFDQENILQNSAITNLDNIRLISEYFAEVSQKYFEASSKVKKQIEKFFISCKIALDIKNFDDLAEAIYKVKQYCKQYQNHLDDQPILDELEKVSNNFKIIIDQAVQDADEKLKQQYLNDETVNIINEQIYIIEKAEKNQLLSQHINMDYVKNQRNNFYKSLLEHFKKISKRIKEILRKKLDQADFKQLESLTNQMNQLRKIKGHESKTINIYHKRTSEIQGLMQQIKKDIEQLLNDCQHYKKKVDFQKIYHSLNQLQCAKWMNDVNERVYKKIVTHIEENIFQYYQIEIVQKLEDLDLSYKNFGNIQVASQLIKDLEAMKQFEEYIPELVYLKEKAGNIFKEGVQQVFNQVRQLISPIQSSHQKEDFKNLKHENKQESIRSIQQSNNTQTLNNKLDGNKVEYYLSYIKACCQTQYKKEAQTLLEQLNKFIENYKHSKIQQINQIYTILIDLKEDFQQTSNTIAGQIFGKFTGFFQKQKITPLQEEDERNKTKQALQLVDLLKELQNIQDYREISQLIEPNLVEYIFGENKFFELYKSYKNDLNSKFKEQYKNILQAIEKDDIQSIKNGLDDNLKNKNDRNKIETQLKFQVENLLEQANIEVSMLGNKVEKKIILQIIKKIDLIKKYQTSLKNYFQSSFLENVDQQIEKIIQSIDQKISIYLQSIKALISQDDFFEVEERKEHIKNIQKLLDGYSKDKENSKVIECLQNELEHKVSEISKIKYEDGSDFIKHSPKQILQKLFKVKEKNLNPIYEDCIKSLNKRIYDKLQQWKVAYSNSYQNPYNQEIEKVQYLIYELPEQFQQSFKDYQHEVNQNEERKKKSFKDQYQQAKRKDLEIKIEFLKNCQQENMPVFQSKMESFIEKEFQDNIKSFREQLENGLLQEGVKQAIKLLQYNKHFEKNHKIKNGCQKASNDIKEEMKIRVNNLNSIQKFDNSDQYIKEYDLFINLLHQMKEYKNQFLQSDFEKTLDDYCSNLYDFFIGIFKNFDEHLENNQVQHIQKDLQIINKWDNLIQKLQNDFQQVNNLSSVFQQLKKLNTIQEKSSSFKECMDKFVYRLSQSKSDILNFNLIKDIDKNTYYQQIQISLNLLKQANEAKINFMDTNFEPECYENECIPFIKNKIKEEEKKVEEILKKDDIQIQDKDYKQINIYYNNLECFRNNIKVENPQIKIEQHIEKIKETIEQKIGNIENSIDLENVDTVAQNIIKMKKHSDNLHPFKDQISNKLDNFLKYTYFKDKKTKANKMAQLKVRLQEDQSGYGAAIIEESEVFKGISLSIFNEVTQRHSIKYVIEKIRGDELETTRLEDLFQKFESEYQKIVQKNLIFIERNTKSDKEIIEDLVTNIKTIAKTKAVLKDGKINWDKKVRQHLPSLLAQIFAIWTLLNTQYFQEVSDLENKQSYLFKPHAGQVVSIFRLLGLGYEKESLYNNLVQIGIGEGKSVILAITSIIFALYDIDIYCACYSEYLSQRDYNSFLQLFNTIGITSNIKYGIFNKICEQIINQHGQIRDLVVDYITNGFTERSKDKSKDKETKPKILLIDEVDVFFSQDFYGKLYNPIARLQDQCISDLAEFIWKKRDNYLSLKSVQETDIYKQCIRKFKNLNCIIDEAIKDMISDSKNFQHQYVVQNRQIGYQEQDSISFDISYGYKTLFAYFYEKEQNRVSEQKLRENTFIRIKCGSFSYSEIPFEFNCIVGVTGILENLSVPEKNIVQKIYKITKSTYIPSVFGKNNLKFAEQKDIHVENEDDYFKALRQEIDSNLNLTSDNKQLRPVLVFFDSTQNLNKFYDSPELSDLRMDVEVITEELSTFSDKKQQLIKKATVSGQVTLLTASFGRGTDFICHDQRVLKSGGVHVIQTFYSNKKSEEVQIMGRSARQGQVGSYSLVLLDQKLQKIIGSDYQEVLEQMRKKDNFYEKLSEYRKLREDQEYDNRSRLIDLVKKDHDEGQKFISAMLNKEEIFIREFLANKNKVDGTASMGPLLSKAKITVSEMFERSCLIIKKSEKSIPEDCFQLQFAVYRDYDQLDGVLQVSPWESKVDNLRLFLEKVQPKGGGDYEEAVEIGLQHANQENKNQKLTAIILLADAPSKSMSQIKNYRKKYGGESYWKKTKYSEITDYKAEMKKLKTSNVPINCFYLNNGAKSNFEKIANFTGCKCESLNIECEEASDTLIKVVVEPILKNVGKQNGLGDDLYKEYLKLFDKSYK